MECTENILWIVIGAFHAPYETPGTRSGAKPLHSSLSTFHSLSIIYFDVLQYKIAPAFDGNGIACALGAFEYQIVDFHAGVTGMAAAGGFGLINEDFRFFDQRAGCEQLESETDRIAVDAREPANVYFNTAYFAAMARPTDLAPNLLDQRIDDG